jgi:translation initiation factor IF-2
MAPRPLRPAKTPSPPARKPKRSDTLGTKRIYEVAKDLNLSSKSLLKVLQELNFDVKTHMAVMTDEMTTAWQQKVQAEKVNIQKEDERKKEITRRVVLSEREREREQQHTVETTKPDLPTVIGEDLQQREFRSRKKRARVRRDRRSKVDQKLVADNVKKTLAEITSTVKTKKKYHRDRDDAADGAAVEDANILRVTEFVSVRELAERLNVSVPQIIAKCLELGLLVTINQRLDTETITIIASEFGFKVELLKEYGEDLVVDDEEGDENEVAGDELLNKRPCIVTIMGHVDHGKTLLLDYIRKTNVIATESGGITQHIGAYQVTLPKGIITFFDTPGHETFTAMRARGAQLTDIVVLVVAADDGIMPQTREAINHAKASNLPLIVAINKVDLPAANIDRVKKQLADNDVLVEEWGGKVQCVPLSAKTGVGVDKLLETILLEAEVLELKANPNQLASGVVVEAELDRGKGPISTVLVQEGTLHLGDALIAGLYHGRIKAMYDEFGKHLPQVGPATPARILGLNGIPQAGDKFHVAEDMEKIREISIKRQQIQREQSFRQIGHVSLDELHRQIADGKIKELNVVIKGDVDGSLEALSDSLMNITHQDVRVKIIHRAVGYITRSDVLLAAASNAIIIGFHVKPDQHAKDVAHLEKVEIRYYRIIYEVIDDIRKALEGMLEPDTVEEEIGTATVKMTVKISGVGVIAGCIVNSGVARRTAKARLLRESVVIFDGKLASLKRFKDDAREVPAGQECGIMPENFKDVKEGDIFEFYEMKKVARKFE